MATAIEFENVGKQYRLGLVSTQTLSHDLNRWWQMNVLHKEDPYLRIGETNDRTVKGHSDYVWALKDINFKVEQGDVVGIIGRNGAGKSTLLKLLSKVTGPSTGVIRARGRIGSLLEVGTGFHPEMTGRENIYMNGAILGMMKSEINKKLDEIVDFSGCERYLDTPVKRYSSGMMVRLGFAVAAHLDPEILVVDEVLAVGDAEFQKKAIGKMKDVSQGEGRTVLFVSHNMDSMLNLCKRGILLNQGEICYSGDITSTVSRYISGKNGVSHYTNSISNARIYTSGLSFIGNDAEKKGQFAMTSPIALKIDFAANESILPSDKSAVAGICIINERETIINISEIPLAMLQNMNTVSYKVMYPGNVLMPGHYSIRVDIHIPNVCYIDRQCEVTFEILDKGSEYIKYKGANNGLIMLHPQISIN